MDKTGGADSPVPPGGCAVDTGACGKDWECYHAEYECGGGKCLACESSAQCMIIDPDSLCAGGFCMKRTHACVEGRCMRLCLADSECPGDDSEREALCVKGRCLPAASTSCLSDGECADPISTCFDQAAPCDSDSDCPAGHDCRRKRCVPGRKPCASDSDCPAGQGCLFGLCTSEKTPCKTNADCGKEGRCISGNCSLPCGNCQEDAHCPKGGEEKSLACVKNYCVHLNASCHDHRCRTFCKTDGECASGEQCAGGMCRPRACFAKLTGEESCRLSALWKAQEKCLNVPCVDSRVDGRIKRVLPENLGELEFGFVPENPEDIDHE